MRFAQLGSLIAFAVAFFLYVAPALRRRTWAEALTLLLWVHVFRYVAVLVIPAQADGYPISNAAVREIVLGDVVGAVMGLAGIFLLRARSRAGVAVAWLVLAEAVADIAVGAHRRLLEPLTVDPTGSLEIVLGFFVPLLLVSLPFLAWQLFSRRHESMA